MCIVSFFAPILYIRTLSPIPRSFVLPGPCLESGGHRRKLFQHFDFWIPADVDESKLIDTFLISEL